MTWLALGLAVLFNVLANISLKLATAVMSESASPLTIRAALENVWLWIGGVSCVLLLLSYLYALRGIGLGTTYAAVTSLALILVTVLSSKIFGEPLTASKGIGIVAVIAGIVLIMSNEVSASTPERQVRHDIEGAGQEHDQHAPS